MTRIPINPYAIYVHCDGSMDYNSRNTGGVGLYIKFPETVVLTEITKTIGRYEGANIERLELEAISQGLDLLTDLFEKERDQLTSINKVIFVTDRFGLSDQEKTSAFRIRDWRHNGWKNFEGKPIKNSDLLDEIDKKRKKLYQFAHCSIEIIYQRRKYNRKADKAAKEVKKQAIADKSIELRGAKIGKRSYSGPDIEYKNIHENQKFIVRVFKKEPVRDEWEICADICKGNYRECKIVIYVDSSTESVLHRHHTYRISVSKVYRYHVRISDDIVEVA